MFSHLDSKAMKFRYSLTINELTLKSNLNYFHLMSMPFNVQAITRSIIELNPKVEQVLRYKSSKLSPPPTCGEWQDKTSQAITVSCFSFRLMYRKVVYYTESRSFMTRRSFTVQIWRLNVRGRENKFLFLFASFVVSLSGRGKRKSKTLILCVEVETKKIIYMH